MLCSWFLVKIPQYNYFVEFVGLDKESRSHKPRLLPLQQLSLEVTKLKTSNRCRQGP